MYRLIHNNHFSVLQDKKQTFKKNVVPSCNLPTGNSCKNKNEIFLQRLGRRIKTDAVIAEISSHPNIKFVDSERMDQDILLQESIRLNECEEVRNDQPILVEVEESLNIRHDHCNIKDIVSINSNSDTKKNIVEKQSDSPKLTKTSVVNISYNDVVQTSSEPEKSDSSNIDKSAIQNMLQYSVKVQSDKDLSTVTGI